MLGTVVNTVAILIGGGIGLLLKKGLSKRVSEGIMTGIGLVVMYIGISGSLEGKKTLVAVLSIAIGGALGSWWNIDGALERLGDYAAKKMGGSEGTFAAGFVNATLVFCVGAMAVVGSMQSGLNGDHATLFAKALIDGISACVFASALGAGVLLSAVSVLLYQGAITLLAGVLQPVLTEAAVAEMTCVGSLLIVAIGLNMIGVSKIKTANYLPAIFLPIVLVLIPVL